MAVPEKQVSCAFCVRFFMNRAVKSSYPCGQEGREGPEINLKGRIPVMKKLSLLLAIVMLASCLGFGAAAEEEHAKAPFSSYDEVNQAITIIKAEGETRRNWAT